MAVQNDDDCDESQLGTLGLQLRDKRLTLRKSGKSFAFGGTIDRRA